MSKRRPPHHQLTGPRAWIPMIAGVVLLVAMFIAFVTYRPAEAFDGEGLWTQAQVVGKRIDRGEDSDTYKLMLRPATFLATRP